MRKPGEWSEQDMAKTDGSTTHSFSAMQTTLIEFPIVVPINVRWGDMDAFGHVNNAAYFTYFEQARIAYFQRSVAATNDGQPTGIGPILKSASCTFRAPVKHPDTLQVAARVESIGEDRFTMVYRAYSETLDRIVAEGQAIVVSYDYDGGRKANLPKDWLEAIDALEGRPVSRAK